MGAAAGERHRLQLLCEGELRACEVGEVDDDQHVLHLRVELGLGLGLRLGLGLG